MDQAEVRYVDALLAALTRDLQEHPVPGELARVVVRWFEAAEQLPAHFEGEGALQAMEQIDPPDAVVAALRAGGALPD